MAPVKIALASFALAFTVNTNASETGNHDPAFNNGENVTTAIVPAPHYDVPTVIGLTKSDANGYIVTTSYFEGNSSYANNMLRLQANGELDTELNGTGSFTLHGPQMFAMTTRETSSFDEMFLVGNYSGGDLAVCAFSGTGGADVHVLTGGTNCITYGAAAFHVDRINPKAIAVQPWDGKIVIVGNVAYPGTGAEAFDMFALRLLADGELDTAFGSGGLSHFLFTGLNAQANAVAFQSDHKIVLAGSASNVGNFDFAAARLDADGTLEGTEPGTFPIPTKITYDFHEGAAYEDLASAVQIDSTGRIYLAGRAESTYDSQYGSTYAVGLVRLTPSFALDTTFFFGSPSVEAYVEGTTSGYESDVTPAFVLDFKGRIMIASGYNQETAWRVLNYGLTDTSYSNGSLPVAGRVEVTKPYSNGITGEFPATPPQMLTDGSKTVLADVTYVYGSSSSLQLSVARLLSEDSLFVGTFETTAQ